MIINTQSFGLDCAHYNVLVIIIVVLSSCFKTLNIWSPSICETLDYKFNMFFTSFILHQVKVYICVVLQVLNYVSFETFAKLQVPPFFSKLSIHVSTIRSFSRYGSTIIMQNPWVPWCFNVSRTRQKLIWRKLKDLTNNQLNNEQELNNFIVWTRHDAS